MIQWHNNEQSVLSLEYSERTKQLNISRKCSVVIGCHIENLPFLFSELCI